MKKIFIGIGAIALLFGAFILLRPTPLFNTSQLDYFFDILDENQKFMGSVAISKNEKLIYTKTIGMADVEKNISANPNTKYRIGSTSKMITAAMIFRAAEMGKLSLNTPINKFFPQLPNAEKITIENLLNHRSGLFSVTSDPTFFDWRTKNKTRSELLAIIENGAVQFAPNEKAAYSNSNYILLSFILEDVFKKSYDEVLQELISTPLNLKNTYLGKNINTRKNETHSYKKSDNWTQQPETNTSIPLGAGGITSTPQELVIFMDALFSEKIISQESLTQMTSITDGYGMGIFPKEINEKVGYDHPGTIDGFNTNLIYIPAENLTVAISTNGDDFNMKNILQTVFDAIDKKPYQIPSFSTYEVDPADLDSYVGAYSSDDIKIFKIYIRKEGNTLFAQATGQDSWAMSAADKHIFRIDAMGARKIEFQPEKKVMIWEQNGKTSVWKKE